MKLRKIVMLIGLALSQLSAEWTEETILRYDKIEYIIAEAASENGVPFERLVALLYVESRFKSNAKSHTGARGIAQFTRATAKSMGVNRLDTVSSIYGASRLLRKHFDQSMKSLTEEQRWNLACIYYNRGKGYHFKAKKALKKRSVRITYKSLLTQYKKYKYMSEGLKYIKAINREIVKFK